MHIADGPLSESLAGQAMLVGGAALAIAGAAIGLSRMDYDRMPKVAVLSSAFFVASLIAVPLPPSSAHLLLNGLTGVILGWAAFPAFAIALFLQFVFFGFGGVTTLGLNTFNFGLAAVICFHCFNGPLRRWKPRGAIFAAGCCAGALGVVAAAALATAELIVAGREFALPAKTVFVAHLPIAAVEGLVTGFIALFLRQTRPEILEAPTRAPAPRPSPPPSPAVKEKAHA